MLTSVPTPFPMGKLALGHSGEASEPEFLRGVLGEFVLTFLFVFIGVGVAITVGKTNGGGALGEPTALALGQALVVSVIATAGSHISGGHINPAVTLAFAVGGHVTLFRSALYVAAQLLGSCTACVLLTYLTATGGLAVAAHALPDGVSPAQGVVAEAVFTFTLLFVIYATILDPRKVAPGMGPMLTGLLVGANTIAGSTLSGASMNPARSFGPALVAGVWTHHWVYWAGPLFGGPFAALVYECVFMDDGSRQLLPQHK